MAFVKWGLDSHAVKALFSIDGVPVRTYNDMKKDRRDLIVLANKLIACCDEERDAALIQEAHALLARIKGE